MKRYGLILAAVLVASPAWAADQWNAGTLTGTGRTEALAYPATCSTSIALAINRRGTSLTNALTKYVVTGAGAISATSATPSSPTSMGKLLALGCDASTAYVGGSAIFLETAALSSLSSWTFANDTTNAGSAFAGLLYTSPAGGGKWRLSYQNSADSKVYSYDLTPPSTFGALASVLPLPSDTELVSTQVSSTFQFFAAQDSSTGRPYFRGYASGTSYAFTSQAGSTMQATNENWYPPYGLNGTLGVATQYSSFYSSTTRAAFVTSAGTITVISVGAFDAIPLGDWDPTGSLRRGWFIRKSNGAAYRTDSASAPSAISADSTYNIGSTPLGGSTPLFAIMGLDMEGDGGTNPVVMMADGTHFAWWGTMPAASSGAPRATTLTRGLGSTLGGTL